MQHVLSKACGVVEGLEKGGASFGRSLETLIELADELEVIFSTHSFAMTEADLNYWKKVCIAVGHELPKNACFLTIYLKARKEVRNLQVIARRRPNEPFIPLPQRDRRAARFCRALCALP